MPPSLVTQLTRHLRADAAGRADILVFLPRWLTDTAPLWSPDGTPSPPGTPRYHEITTASVWARSAGPHCHVTVHHRDDDGHDLMTGGLIDPHTLLAPGGVHANPGTLARLATVGTTSTRRMAPDHPLLRYRRWADRLEHAILWRLQSDAPSWEWQPHRLQRCPDGRWRMVFTVSDDRRRADVTGWARSLSTLVRFLGAPARVRVRAFDPARFDGPLHAHARRTFTHATQPDLDKAG